MIGLYLDALAAAGEWEALDRVLTAQSWCNGVMFDYTGARCIRGWAEDYGSWDDFQGRKRQHAAEGITSFDALPFIVRAHFPLGYTDDDCVPTRYNRLHQRHGDRLIRAIKQRAGKWTRPHIPEQLVVSPESSVARP